MIKKAVGKTGERMNIREEKSTFQVYVLACQSLSLQGTFAVGNFEGTMSGKSR